MANVTVMEIVENIIKELDYDELVSSMKKDGMLFVSQNEDFNIRIPILLSYIIDPKYDIDKNITYISNSLDNKSIEKIIDIIEKDNKWDWCRRYTSSAINCIISQLRNYKKYKVFLAGTCNGSIWRDHLMALLRVKCFNPVVDDWNEEAQKNEIEQRKLCKYTVVCITPSMTGLYSIAELIDDLHEENKIVIFCVLKDEIPINYVNIQKEIQLNNPSVPKPIYPMNKIEFDESEMKSFNAIGEMVKRHDGLYTNSLQQIANYINKMEEK